LHWQPGEDTVTDSSLGTTNLLLGIMAAVSVLQAIVLAGVAVAAWKVYVRSLEGLTAARRQIEPVVARVSELAERVEGIADDVKNVTSRVALATARAESAVDTAATVVGYGVGGATATVARRTLRIYGIARGLRAAYRSFVRRDTEPTLF
jgi:hypothetical protein